MFPFMNFKSIQTANIKPAFDNVNGHERYVIYESA